MEIEQENGRDPDVIKVNEYMKSEKTPKNTKLDTFFKLYQYCNDTSKNTISDTYSNGDNRGDLSKKFSDYVDLYKYVYDNLIIPELKEAFHKHFGKVINKLVYGREVNSIELSLLMEMELCEADSAFLETNYCKGYIARIENAENDYYGFIIKKIEITHSDDKKKSSSKKSSSNSSSYMLNQLTVYPFVVNDKFRCVLERFVYTDEKLETVMLNIKVNYTMLIKNIIKFFNKGNFYKFSDRIFIPDFNGKEVTFNSII